MGHKTRLVSSVFSHTDYSARIASTGGGKTRIEILSPVGEHSKTVSVERVMYDSGLGLDIIYYGELDVNQLRALGACAVQYGCDHMYVGTECIHDVTSW